MTTPTNVAAWTRVGARALLRTLAVVFVALGAGWMFYHLIKPSAFWGANTYGAYAHVVWGAFVEASHLFGGAAALLLADWLLLRWIVPLPAPSACAACAYDLSGVKGVRCPECGAVRE